MKNFTYKVPLALIAASSLQQKAAALQVAEEEPAKKASKCPFGYGGTTLAQDEDNEQAQNPAENLYDLFNPTTEISEGGQTNLDRAQMVETYDDIFTQVYQAFDNLPTEITAQNNPRAAFVGCVLRTSGHDFMDYRVNVGGGSDGCVNFNDPDNKGLKQCLIATGMLEIYNNRKHDCSLADFLIIVSEAAMARSHTSYNSEDTFAEGTLAKSFRDGFKFNRADQRTCENTGLMPNPEHGCFGRDGKDGLQQIFIDHIYKGRTDAWTLTAAISGAHTVGGAHLENSGYNGYWGSAEQQGIFNNDYYISLMTKGWGAEVAVDENSGKNQWKRVDLPIDTTPEDLKQQYKKRQINKEIYTVQLDRLLDPKRGLMENPVEGIKGHHEMMLSTDICLVYLGNKEFSKCKFGTENHYRRQKDKGMTTDQRYNDCKQSLWEPEFYHELFPEENQNCCNWMKQPNMYLWGFSSKDEEKAFCGVNVTDEQLGLKTCCQSGARRDCGSIYWASGPAYEDIAQFAGNEEIWIRKFLEAWHIATENGVDTTEMNEESFQHRHDLEEKHQTNCRGLFLDACKETENCEPVIVGKAQDTRQNWNKACRNKHLLVSEQAHEGENFHNYRDLTSATLVNAIQSSTVSSLYPATNALNRQNSVQLRAEGKAWGKHAFLVDELDTSPEQDQKDRLKTSCAITEIVSAEQPTAWWQADFAEGELTVEEVEVQGEFYKALWDRAYFGARVYIDDKLCAEIDVATMTSQFSRTNGYKREDGKRSQRFESSLFYAYCDSPITGSSVRIETDRAPLETDLYKSGLAICDVRVNLNTREPTFGYVNQTEGIPAYKAENEQRIGYTEPSAESEMGKKHPQNFEECGFMKNYSESEGWVKWNQ